MGNDGWAAPRHRPAFGSGLAPARRLDGKWGSVDARGAWALEPRWDFASPFSRDARSGGGATAVVGLGTTQGAIDRTGATVLPPVYARVFDADEGLRPLCEATTGASSATSTAPLICYVVAPDGVRTYLPVGTEITAGLRGGLLSVARAGKHGWWEIVARR